MDAVWLEEVPASARSSLQNQLARLRRSFGDDLIETNRKGYTLRGSTDARAFEVAATAGSARGLAPEVAVRQLSRAVALWGGPPFEALLEHPEADCEARRLVIMRQQVDESLAAARINSGDPDTAVVELEVLVTADPYRERSWELLMRALDAAGRPGEAVAAHERMARRLGEDLGATPSRYMMGLRDLITNGSPLGPAMAGRSRAGRVSSTAGCGGPVPIRRRARCGDSYRTQRTWGGAE
jgi:DNA-binding SARP family transcriptional activator